MKKEKTKRNRVRASKNGITMGLHISDELWAVLQSRVPPHVITHCLTGERPYVAGQARADTIFPVLRTGCQWQPLDRTGLCLSLPAYISLKVWHTGPAHLEELRGMENATTRALVGGAQSAPNSTSRGTGGVKRQGQEVPIGPTSGGTGCYDTGWCVSRPRGA